MIFTAKATYQRREKKNKNKNNATNKITYFRIYFPFVTVLNTMCYIGTQHANQIQRIIRHSKFYPYAYTYKAYSGSLVWQQAHWNQLANTHLLDTIIRLRFNRIVLHTLFFAPNWNHCALSFYYHFVFMYDDSLGVLFRRFHLFHAQELEMAFLLRSIATHLCIG